MQLVLGTARARRAPPPDRRAAPTRCSPASRPTSAPTAARSLARSSPSDRSIQIHSCHGRARQVEILRDAILHLLDEDDTLQPRDVIVMCPDIESFAPADPGHVRRGRRRRRRRVRAAPRGAPPDRPARPPRRPLAAPDQPRARRRRPADRPRRPPPHRLRRARPRRPRARPPPLQLRRRGPRADPRLGRRQRHPLGARRGPPRARTSSRTCPPAPGGRASTACSSASR